MSGPSHDRPVLRRTLAFLDDYVRTSAPKPGGKLPPVRELTSLAGVSYVTLCKALRAMRDSGHLTLVNGRYHVVRESWVHLPDGATLRPRPAPTRPWRRVADKVSDDIRNGVHRPGAPLPSMKELQRRYRVAYRTVRKALEQLVREQSLDELAGGTFAAPQLSTSAWRPRIVCILGSPDSHRMAFGQHDETLFRALESFCGQARIKVDVYLQFGAEGRHRFRHPSSGRLFEVTDLETLGGDSVQGFTYFILWPTGAEDVRTIKALLANRKPVVVLDETASLAPPAGMVNSRYLRLFTAAASRESARIVAGHLLSLQHRRVAFISVDHQFVWSQLRLEGLQSAFSEAGHLHSIRSLVFELPELREQAARRSDFASLVRAVDKWRAKLPAQYRDEFAMAIDKMEWEHAARAEQRLVLQPVFDQALADREITAWVLVNDTTAAMAMAFLKEKGVRVPADLSVISFDDSPIALMNNISSYNFNVPALAASMLGFILNRKPYSDPGGSERGFIVDRGSTGQVPTRRATAMEHG